MEPAKSPVLLKATGAIKHEGAQQIAADSPEYKTILAWIEQGARYDNPALPKLAGVSFGAAEAVLAKGAARALSVTAEYSDGSRKDPKPNAAFEHRGAFKPIPTNVPGIEICETLPMMASTSSLATRPARIARARNSASDSPVNRRLRTWPAYQTPDDVRATAVAQMPDPE